MRIGIITHYDVHNHGALLQLNALVKFFNKKGYEAFALKYDKNYDFLGTLNKKKYNIGIHSVPLYLKYLLSNGVKKTVFNINKRKILNEFKEKENLTKGFYTEYKTLDAVCIGSDEVFALHTGPTPVLFGYVLPTEYSFTYAASFGPTNMEDIISKHCYSFVKGGLNSIDNISVRDENSRDIVKELTGIVSELVCDPVLLYGYEEEIKEKSKIDLKDYLLIYSYDSNMNDPIEVQKIKIFAEESNLLIVSVGFYHKWCDKNINVNPIELIHYFRKSKYVITDTFHGSVLSILNNSNFAVVLRNNSNKLLNLLEEYGLKDRIINNNFEGISEVLYKNINYTEVIKELNIRRQSSISFLEKCISNISDK
ncbi:MAG: polysaccharide pyruvyl transferase family protein [Bacilli bacterium]|nr:polysaccharide pyruvyl transferase family protein [Bacilli bacterium]